MLVCYCVRMDSVIINYWAVLVAALAQMALGSMWYGPLFGKEWMRLSGIGQSQIDGSKKDGMSKLYLAAFIGSFVMSYVLAHFVQYFDATTVGRALQLAFWTWLGFVATIMLGDILWKGIPRKLFVIQSGYQLVSIMISAVILALWQ